MAYPTSLDTFTDVNPRGLVESATINALNHAVVAIETKVGTDASTEANVLTYLAAGDGFTNDTSAIRAAITAAGTNGRLVFPSGTYMVDGLTAGETGQVWDLHPGATIKLRNSRNTHVIEVTAARVHIRGGTVDGNAANNSSGDGIRVSSVDDCTIENVSVNNANDYGIRVDRSNDTRTLRCRVTDSGSIGIFYQALAAGGCAGGLIHGNIVDRTGISAGSVSEGGIKVHGDPGSGNKAIRVTISDNHVYMPTNPTDITAICIEVWGGSDYASIHGNECSGGRMGVSVDRSPFSAVTGNVIYNCKSQGIELALSPHCAVSGNTVDGNNLSSYGIAATSSSPRCAVTGNVIRNIADLAIRWIGDSDYTTLANNTLSSFVGYGIAIEDAARCVLAGNSIEGGKKSIYIKNSDGHTVSGNVMADATEHAILLHGTTATTFDNYSFVGNVMLGSVVGVSTSLSGSAALGNNIKLAGNIGVDDHADFVNAVKRVTGTATPEGAVTAGVGSIFQRRNGGASTSLYVKESGTGNTGWVAK